MAAKELFLLLLLSGAAVVSPERLLSAFSGLSNENLLLTPGQWAKSGAIPYQGTPLANKIAPLHAQFCQAHRS